MLKFLIVMFICGIFVTAPVLRGTHWVTKTLNQYGDE